jgi:hypothetical protein
VHQAAVGADGHATGVERDAFADIATHRAADGERAPLGRG